MEAPANIPPIIERPRRSTEAPTFFALVAGAILIALLTGYLGIGFPECSFKKMTGLPCAFCGGTRALRAIGHLHFAQAFWFNPLVMLGACAAAVSAIFWAVVPRQFDWALVKAKKLPLMIIGIVLVVLNWLFVLTFLPR
jgi:hypothetical protein